MKFTFTFVTRFGAFYTCEAASLDAAIEMLNKLTRAQGRSAWRISVEFERMALLITDESPWNCGVWWKEKPDASPVIKELQGLGNLDPEHAHVRGDRILCELLISLGYSAVVEEWNKLEKWYA